MAFLKRIAATFPRLWQYELRRIYYGLRIQLNRFSTTEPEYALLPMLLSPGDFVIDVGANVGHYTKRISDLVGKKGHVIALEPVPETFAMLASNVQHFHFTNLTLLNAAASDETALVGMLIPELKSGLKNFYQAHLVQGTNALEVMTLQLDALAIPQRIALVKIDVEGHEAAVLRGMAELLHRDHPILIVETRSSDVETSLCNMGYHSKRLDGSPNILFQ